MKIGSKARVITPHSLFYGEIVELYREDEVSYHFTNDKHPHGTLSVAKNTAGAYIVWGKEQRLIDAREAIERMSKLIEVYSRHGYGDATKYNLAVEDCCGIIRGMMEDKNNDIERVHNVPAKRVLRAKAQR